MTARAPRPAYTLIELVLVLAIIILMAAMAFPSLDAMYADQRVTAAADQVRAAWVNARTLAVNEGRPYRFAVTPNSNRYRVSPLGATAQATSGDSNGGPPTDLSATAERTLPKGITFRLPENAPTSGSDPDGFADVVVFLPDGTAQEDREITLSVRNARPQVVKVRALTGIVTVEPVPQSERGKP